MITDWMIIKTTSIVPWINATQLTKLYNICHIITDMMLLVNTTISEATIPNSNALIMVSATMKIAAPENA
jgi:hypothetical protein